ncbi:hypothetical protein RRG08_019140, partial [Elysia crispata]
IEVAVAIIVVILFLLLLCFIKFRTICMARVKGPPEEQLLRLSSEIVGDTSCAENDLKWDDAKAMIRSFLRTKESEYKERKSNKFRYIYIETDPGTRSQYGHSVLRSHVENFFYDKGYKFRYFNHTTLRVDLKMEASAPPQAV